MSQIINPPTVNYMPQQQPDFMQSYLEGLKFGQDLQTFKKQQELNLKQEAFNQDYQGLLQNPSGSGMLNLMTKYPEFAKNLQPLQEAYSTQEKQGQLSTMMQISSALENGNPDLAKQLVEGAKTAFKNSGMSTQNLDIISQTIDANPQAALGSINMTLAQLMGADKYKLFQEAQTTAAERPYKVSESASKAKSSQVQMEIDISTKQAKIDELRAKAAKATSDAEKAEIETKIAVATKDLKIAEQAYKTETEKSKAGQEAIKLEFLPKEKQLEVEKQGYDIKKVIADIKLTNESTKLKTLEVALQKAENPLKIKELKGRIAKLENEISEKVKEKVFEFENTVSTYNNTINTIDKILNNPQLDRVLGPFDGRVPGTTATQNDAIANIETLQSQIFLSQVKELKGTGALSDAEGKKLDASIASLDRKQSADQFKNNVKEIKNLMMKGIQRTSNKYGMKPKIERPNLKTNSAEVRAILEKYGVK